MLRFSLSAVLYLRWGKAGSIGLTLGEQARPSFAYNPRTIRTKGVGASLRLATTRQDYNGDECEYFPRQLSHQFVARPIESLRQPDMLKQYTCRVDWRR